MYCRHCGHKLTEGSKFCNDCGKGIDEPTREKISETSHSAAKKEAVSDKKSSPVAAIIITVIIAGAVLIWIMSSVNSYSPQNSLPNESTSSSVSSAATIIPTDQNTPPKTSASTANAVKSLADITKEWQGSTAYVVCDWYYSNGNLIQELSGSGLLATLNSTPTIDPWAFP
jgi:cytoskeletal protein RodZ